MSKIGEWTEKVEVIKNNLKGCEVVTEEGEVVKLHANSIEDLAMEIVDYAEKLNGTDENSILRQKVKEIIKAKQEQTDFQKTLSEMYGNFYFSFYRRFMDMDKKYLFRFCYLCAYMNYDNHLVDNRKLIHYEDLNDYLKLTKTDYYATIKYLKENEFIYVNEKDQVLINKKFCKKGQIGTKRNVEFTRTFNEAIKEIYENSKTKEHKKLALLIRILPYINFKYNMICSNPEEEYLENVDRLSMKDLADILGYGRTNSNRLKNDLFKLRINDELVVGIWETDYGKTIYVNSRLFYKGNDNDDLGTLYKMFNESREKC